MTLGIDASNLRAGGGVTHLVELLRAAQPHVHGIGQVIVWGGRATLEHIVDTPWLVKAHEPTLDGSLARRLIWQRRTLARRARAAGCDVLLVPGGSYSGDFRPFVTMSRTLLPFEGRERHRYGWSWMRWKLALLRAGQADTLRRADGVIFLNDYARRSVTRATGALRGLVRVIPHGVSAAFRATPRPQRSLDAYSTATPLRVLYVSTVDMYKHQWHVVDAVGMLRGRGLPVVLDLIGGAYPPALQLLRDAIARVDPDGRFVTYLGAVPHAELPSRYLQADVFVFASSCENMPNTLLEAMAAGLPIACAHRGPMPEILGDAGVYFDPEQPDDIARAIEALLTSPSERARVAEAARARVESFTWEQCAHETLAFTVELSGHSERSVAGTAAGKG